MLSGHGTGVDHWSFGVLIYEMLLGVNPFQCQDMDDTAFLLKSITQEPHTPPTGVSEDAQDMINRLLEKDPTHRLGSLARGEADILHHAWLDGLDLQEMRRRRVTAPWIPSCKNAMDASCFDDWGDLEDKTEQSYPKISAKDAKEFEGF
jgi:serum/glucocorticoid-regulated kinase 2